jgi:hypothetical protein
MSKTREEDVPPPYSEVGSSSQHAFTSHLESHLASLPTLIRESQEAHASSQTATDVAFISLISPHLESLLHKIASRPNPPALAELILVPSAPVAGWVFSGEKADEGEVKQLVRVVDTSGITKGHGHNASDSEGECSTNTNMSKSNPWQTKDEFDDWGRWGSEMDGGNRKKLPGDWWWNDETLAVRLARHLQPKPKPKPKTETPEPSPVESPMSPVPARSNKWSFFRSPDPIPSPAWPRVMPRLAQDEEQVSMTAKAEEVTFRRENEFGVFESKNGYGIVVRVRTRLRR